ncbi:MAG: hypothetical protein HYS60_02400 [Candidatus Wildermuthbacteria bacterium]|nr:hypothetical protein [Candidatus Wildermuthbacteria bacterium]
MKNTTIESVIKRKSRERSVAYPSLNLESAVDSVAKLRSALGKGPYSREDAAKALGYSGLSGASARAVAALVHYGLLERNGNTYFTSELSEEIVHPTDDTGMKKLRALVMAARTPRLFERLISKFQSQSLPGLLENILMREGVSSGSAKEAATTFKETLQYAGLLKNGVVSAVEQVTEDGSEMQEKPEQSETERARMKQVGEESPYNFSKMYSFTDSGEGWDLKVVSERPIPIDTKTAILGIAGKLDMLNSGQDEKKEAGIERKDVPGQDGKRRIQKS